MVKPHHARSQGHEQAHGQVQPVAVQRDLDTVRMGGGAMNTQSGNLYAAISRTCLRASKRSAKRKALVAVSREIVMELIALSVDMTKPKELV